MFRTCYTTVSDLAVCQRCPALFGYKVHRKELDAWRVGIHGSGHFYGSLFHKNISQVFFEAAANPYSPLHPRIVRAVSRGTEGLEEVIRENIFMPFVAKYSEGLTSGQVMAMAQGVSVWVRAMSDFFREIPSLLRDPVGNMRTVFHQPEQKLRSCYDFPKGYGRLIITGCYDALMFNPDKAEARLFEFKGYSRSDLAVPLSQSLIYAWLIERVSGVVPSVEIIYLDEQDRKPDVFASLSVKEMIYSGLPGLFYSAFNTITLRRLPEILRDKKLCSQCRFSNDCASDWSAKFRRRASSMINVLVFFIAALMICSHVFFFSGLTQESIIGQTQELQQRFRFEKVLHDAIEAISGNKFEANTESPDIENVEAFNSTVLNAGTKKWAYDSPDIHVHIHDLYYKLKDFDTSDYVTEINNNKKNDAIEPFRVFPPMIGTDTERFFLIRVYTSNVRYRDRKERALMYQVLVRRTGTSVPYTVRPLSFMEMWY